MLICCQFDQFICEKSDVRQSPSIESLLKIIWIKPSSVYPVCWGAMLFITASTWDLLQDGVGHVQA